jgi:arginine/lysine/ornithine decarboxylase
MVDPKMTKFRAMSLDEQAMTIEKSSQETLRAREEMLATEEAVTQVAAEAA